MYKILIVDDDLALATVLKDYFVEAEPLLNVLQAEDGDSAISIYENEHPHLILLDVVLPKKNGFEVITEIRAKDSFIPILLMTGNEVNPESIVKGYDSGAINYLMKPVSPKTLLAQIKSLLHLSYGTECYTVGGCHIIIESQQVKINEESVLLREKDIQVLSMLLKSLGRVVPRQLILRKIWQNDDYSRNNSLDSSVSRIRKAFLPFSDIILEPVYAAGYLLRKN